MLVGLKLLRGEVYTRDNSTQIMRLMGLDVGDKRIGVAVSDDSELIASPKETVERRGTRKDVAHLLEIARREEVAEIVVGMPYSLDGSEGPQAAKVRRFIEAVEDQTELPVTTWDERYTTVVAEEMLHEVSASRTGRKKNVDRVAAALILQGYLDKKRESGPKP